MYDNVRFQFEHEGYKVLSLQKISDRMQKDLYCQDYVGKIQGWGLRSF